jgi:hypothetical protein
MGIHEELAQKHKSADERRDAHNPIRKLLCYFLELAIDDLDSADPIKRRRARWWIYEDLSTGVDTKKGYLSFQGTCEALDIDAQAVRKALKNQRHNGNGVEEKNGAEKGNSNGRGRNPKPQRNRRN